MIYGIDRAFLDDYWAVVRKDIDKALSHSIGEVTLEQVYALIREGKMLLFVATDEDSQYLGAAVVELVLYPAARALRVVALGGKDFDQWDEALVEHLMEGAKIHDCDWIEEAGRKGWQRRLLDLGFRQAYVVMTKRVE